jgi:D-tyrosyl-tRNA(Tyr) deacylase
MRLVIQRVKESKVVVSGSTVGAIRRGLLVLIGIAREDTREEADYMVDKLLGLRIFPDESGKMNRNIVESEGSLLLVSQFTLYGDCRKGRRPSFDRAAPPSEAQPLYEYFVERARKSAVPVETGIFQASMEVHLINDGPVTLLLDSADRQKKTAS